MDDCWVCSEVRFLLDAGELGPTIAKRLGRNREGLQRHLRHHDPALLDRYNRAMYADTEMRRPA